MGRGLAVGAQLALAAVMSIGLATTTQIKPANTLPSLKTRVPVAAPSQEDLAAAEEVAHLNKAMAVLSDKDAALYRTIFAAQQKGDRARADRLLLSLSDKRLVGSVIADRFEKQGGTAEELVEWLNAFPTHPEATMLYTMARNAGVKTPPRPEAADTWSGGGEVDSAANFSPDLMVKSTAPNSGANKAAVAIRKALRKGDPWAAKDLLLAIQNDKQLAGTFAADAQAVVAEAFFRVGERDQATALANAAAGANQPLGLWIRGLIAWEKDDFTTAKAAFNRLTTHPALSDTNRAAAHFWAYRAESKNGNKRQAHEHLEHSATTPRSFYGLLAAQLLERNPSTLDGKKEALPKWSARHRSLLSAHPSGWRALALVQIGQAERAEAELRRLNPLGNTAKQEAMLALANYVPMPALALQLASLSGKRGFDPMAYPLLPWEPSTGFSVDKALLFALARHESLFDPTAISTRGARGLMQIMPATANVMVKRDATLLAMAEARDGDIFDPSFNMAVGQEYVQHLASLPQIGNNLMLLLAAYNGGPAKAMNWAQGKESVDPLLFLESIPVRETRNYIARVLPHYWAYRTRLGRPTTALRELAEGKWPHPPLNESKAVRVAEATAK